MGKVFSVRSKVADSDDVVMSILGSRSVVSPVTVFHTRIVGRMLGRKPEKLRT
jgi:hypothetical protein